MYDRLLYDTEFSFESYQDALKAQGFELLEAIDISSHLRQSYLCLADRTPKGDTGEHAEHYEWLTEAYLETAKAVEKTNWAGALHLPQVARSSSRHMEITRIPSPGQGGGI